MKNQKIKTILGLCLLATFLLSIISVVDNSPLKTKIDVKSADPYQTVGYMRYYTLVGGSSSDSANAVVVDDLGCTYIAGHTYSSDFPTTTGVIDETPNGKYDVYISKINAAGTGLEFSTFLGGSGSDLLYDIYVDESGSIYLLGYTESSDFPTTAGVIDETPNGGYDIFICKINSDGTEIEYSTLLGGSASDQGKALAVDDSGCVYITGSTSSTDFPTTKRAIDRSHNGQADVFVSKINADGSSLLYSTYLGGSNMEGGQDIVVNAEGCAIITGYTYSSNFPTTSGVIDYTHGGGNDVFICKISDNARNLLYSTFLGGSGNDCGNSIVLSNDNTVIIAGYAQSTTFPTTSGVIDETHNGYYDAFITKINADGTAIIFSTFLGGSDYDSVNNMILDSAGNIYITGSSRSLYFPMSSMCIDPFNTGVFDVIWCKINNDATELIYSTFAGGQSSEYGMGITVDSVGDVYVAGYSYSDWKYYTIGPCGATDSDALIIKYTSIP
ncbi:MAG: SBBP repeat-containing protein [Candidatus Lokiarchaeota archaeon]|nr:SBBP repeat-containing protein [Candidatus Lokiarchaeota archaeon]